MKLENFTDLQTWAVEQWGDAELGDSRRIQRAIAVRLLQLRTISCRLPQLLAREFVPKIVLKVLVARLGLYCPDLTLAE